MTLEQGRFFGSTAASRQIAGLAISETLYPPSLVIPSHDHELASLCVVQDGAYDQRYGERRRECLPGMIIFHPAGERHANTHRDASVRMLCVEIGRARSASLREAIDVLDRPAHFRGGELGRLGARLAYEFHRADSASALAIEAVVLEMLVESERSAVTAAAATVPSWLARAIEYLHAHFTETPTVGEIAEAVGVHPAHLSRVFRRHQRCTVGDYVRHLRIECARDKLVSSELSLGEIALQAGFTDQSHFCRHFRAATGHTPASYRRMRS